MVRETHVRTELLSLLMRERKLNDTLLSTALNMDRTTVFRARSGKPVGEQFIAGLLAVFPHKRFEDLFYVDEVLRKRNKTAVRREAEAK